MKKKVQFSKALLIQESILVWIITLALVFLTFYCVHNQYFGELPWIVGVAGFPWTAYGVSQACYYKKSEKENTEGGIVYMTAKNELESKNENASSQEEAVG